MQGKFLLADRDGSDSSLFLYKVDNKTGNYRDERKDNYYKEVALRGGGGHYKGLVSGGGYHCGNEGAESYYGVGVERDGGKASHAAGNDAQQGTYNNL